MGNPPFEDVFPIKNGGFSIAMLVYQRVFPFFFKLKNAACWNLWSGQLQNFGPGKAKAGTTITAGGAWFEMFNGPRLFVTFNGVHHKDLVTWENQP